MGRLPVLCVQSLASNILLAFLQFLLILLNLYALSTKYNAIIDNNLAYFVTVFLLLFVMSSCLNLFHSFESR